jgi:O-antigen/teichoic acid export membrane protein
MRDDRARPIDGGPAGSTELVEVGLFQAPTLVESGQRMGGVRAGAIVFAGVAAANVGNAAFHLIAGRWLGPAEYADLAALLALLGLVSFPLGAVQIALAQRVAYLAARREGGSIRSLYRATLGAALAIGTGLMLVMAATAGLIGRALDVDGTLAVLMAAASVLPAALAPVVIGLAQGLERFVLFAATQAGAPVLRIISLIPLLALGAGVPGALTATLAASLLVLLVPGWLLAGWLRSGTEHSPLHSLRPLARSLLPAVAGILALTSLTTVDVIVAKIAFSDHDAGIYGAASLVGRLILYVPAAIVAVLLPKVASRVALGERTNDILRGSLVVTGAFCLAATAVYAAVPDFILALSFGDEYSEASGLLWLFGIAMTGFALVNVLFIYDLGHGSSRMSWILCAGAVAQLVAFTAVHESPRALVLVSILVAFTLILVGRLALRARET